jgi:hypothetical protein
VSRIERRESWWEACLRRECSFWNVSLDEYVFGPTPAKKERYANFAAAGRSNDAFERFTDTLREEFTNGVPPLTKPTIRPATPCDRDEVRRSLEREALKGMRIWRRGERKRARAEAGMRLEQTADQIDRSRRDAVLAQQAELDRSWESLWKHERLSVLRSLEDAFKRAPYDARVYGASDEAVLVFVSYSDAAVPYCRPDLTPTGKLTTRKLTKTDRNSHYAHAVMLVTYSAARRALAAAPAANEATAVVFQYFPHGAAAWVCLGRSGTQRGSGVPNTKGRAGEVVQADFADWPELGGIVSALDARGKPEAHSFPDWTFLLPTRPDRV